MSFRFVSKQSKTSHAVGMSSLIFLLQAKEPRLSVCFNTLRNFNRSLNKTEMDVPCTNNIREFKHGAILYNEAEVFSLSITNPNGRPMLPFDWLIRSSLILASCRVVVFEPVFCDWEINLITNIRKKIQTNCEGNIFYLR